MQLETVLCDRCQSKLTVEERTPSPPLQEMFRSTYKPSDVEISQVNSLIESANRDLERYDAEIRKVAETFLILRKRRDDLLHYRDRCYSIVSSFRRIPAEIWTEVFLYTLGSRRGLLVTEDFLVAPPVVLSQICSLWRNVATLGSPELWSDLCLNVASNWPGVQHLVDLYLDRSKSAPLTLKVKAELNRTQGKQGHVKWHKLCSWGQSVLKSLVGAGDRWRTASFEFHRDILGEESIWKSSSCFPVNLESLVILFESEPSEALTPLPNDFFSYASKLQSLEAAHFYTSNFHVKNLRKLKVHEQTADIFFLLDNCPHLQEIDLPSSEGPESYTVSAPIVCNELRSMTYNSCSSHTLAAIAEFITFPSLTRLELANCSDDSESRQAMFLSLRCLLQQSGCQLQVLTLRMDVFASDRQLVEILLLTPTVTDFGIYVDQYYGGILTNNLLQTLSFTSDISPLLQGQTGVCLLPQMTHFRLGFVEEVEGENPLPDPEGIFSVVNSRRTHSSAKHSRIVFFELRAQLCPASEKGQEWEKAFKSVERRLRALEKDGLDLDMEYRDIHSEEDEEES
ncbi:hypothetical protein D9758_007964 [Tetrapyrgos nigripes]|uniref:F-box domain-containing protein n=1 Tax=Tetrapyrgos nigripes TaxID=182062 RepID=A0A8H5D676_9AGAR|nr:hypothetical protein D9758_007964 [Tetrapyrgos nigripes]